MEPVSKKPVLRLIRCDNSPPPPSRGRSNLLVIQLGLLADQLEAEIEHICGPNP